MTNGLIFIPFLNTVDCTGAPRLAGVETWANALLWITRRLGRLQLQHAPFIHPDQSCFLVGIRAEAAPRPLLWPFHQTTLNRIAADVSQFLHPLFQYRGKKLLRAVMEGTGVRYQRRISGLERRETRSTRRQHRGPSTSPACPVETGGAPLRMTPERIRDDR